MFRKGSSSVNNVFVFVLGCCLVISSKASSATKECLPDFSLSLMMVSSSLKHRNQFCTTHSLTVRRTFTSLICEGPSSSNNVRVFVLSRCSTISSKAYSSRTECIRDFGWSLRQVSPSLKRLNRFYASHSLTVPRSFTSLICEGPNSANNVWVLVFGCCSTISSKAFLTLVCLWGWCHLPWKVWTNFLPHIHWQFLGLPYH